MRGRKRKPLSSQIAAGDPRKHGKNKLQEALDNVPKATKGLPPCPKHLRGRARAAWKFWTVELEAMGLDRRPDAMMLEGACVSYEAYVRALENARKFGDVVDDPILDKEGLVIGHKFTRNPWVLVRERSLLLLKGFCSEFGLSPVSRERLSIEKRDDGEQDLAELLSRPRAARETPTTVN